MSSTENGQLTHRSHGRGEGMGVSLLELDRKDQIKVERPVYTQIKFDEGYEHTKPKSKSAKEYACDIVKEHFTCSKKCLKSFVLRTFPFIKIMQHYVFPQWLISDLISGLTVGIMHLPQGKRKNRDFIKKKNIYSPFPMCNCTCDKIQINFNNNKKK